MNDKPDDRSTISKSQLKRDAKERFALGKQLSELSESELLKLPLDAQLLEDLLFARQIKSHVARKRQLGTVARRLRLMDVSELEAALDRRQEAARELNSRHHRVEAWRDRLLENGSSMLTRLLTARQDLEVQQMRQLLRNAAREAQAGKPPASARKLFRLLREADERQALPPLE